MAKIVPVTQKNHAGKSLLPLKSFDFARNQSLIPALATEFPQLAANFPIVFLQTSEEQYSVFALCGLKKDENVFVDAEGKWQAPYVPLTIRRYPFVFARDQRENSENYVLCIDEESGLLSEQEGTPLFTSNGEKSELLERAMAFGKTYQRSAKMSTQLCEQLVRYDLLQPFSFQLKGKDEKKLKISGLSSVDEKKLNQLSDEDFLEIRKSGALPLIYMHLFSLGRIRALVDQAIARQ